MTEARARHEGGVISGGGEETHIASVLTAAASWVVAVVFIKWCVAGPPFQSDDSPPVLLAAMRAALGLLVISIVRLRPAAVAVAWLFSLAIAGHGGVHWLTTGHASPYGIWEVLIPAAYVVFLPLAIWATPEHRRVVKVVTERAPVAPTTQPRRTTGSMPAIAEPYGTGLANKVADLLERGQSVIYGHADYCGTGLRFVAGRYVYDEVWNGELACLRQQPPAFDKALKVFGDRATFVAWLAQQCDQSLSGRDRPDPYYWNNQRITRTRLERAVEVARVTGDFAVVPGGSPTARPQA
jgi:hypothetical protein